MPKIPVVTGKASFGTIVQEVKPRVCDTAVEGKIALVVAETELTMRFAIEIVGIPKYDDCSIEVHRKEHLRLHG
jgi:hypothetical protein